MKLLKSKQALDKLGDCPKCGVTWSGQKYAKTDEWAIKTLGKNIKWPNPDFSRLIGNEDIWYCPDCHAEFPRDRSW